MNESERDLLKEQARAGNSMRHQRDIRGSVTDIPRDRQTDRPTDGQTVPLIEMQ